MNFRSIFAEPIILFLALQLPFLMVLLRRRGSRLIALVLLVSLGALGYFSTPGGSECLESHLRFETRVKAEKAPQIITVLSAGFYAGKHSYQDVISDETVARLLTAIEWWMQNPEALLVMQGESGLLPQQFVEGRTEAKKTELMADFAQKHGVPANHILIEPVSRNTHEHPLFLAKIKEVRPDHVIGVVTSTPHLRRAILEFGKVFDHVVACPISLDNGNPTVGLKRWLPSSDGLFATTIMLHELVGLLWYHLRF
ncbi:MAG: YdcF family protein [Methylotenera sp.]|nr:YdcF family protein [Oligoflexia bacterium]